MSIIKDIKTWVKEYNDFKNDKYKKSHFEDINDADKKLVCTDSSHNPPMHLHIPSGKKYIHICPKCGNRVIVMPPNIHY